MAVANFLFRSSRWHFVMALQAASSCLGNPDSHLIFLKGRHIIPDHPALQSVFDTEPPDGIWGLKHVSKLNFKYVPQLELSLLLRAVGPSPLKWLEPFNYRGGPASSNDQDKAIVPEASMVGGRPEQWPPLSPDALCLADGWLRWKVWKKKYSVMLK